MPIGTTLAADTAFEVVFGVFVVAFAVLVVITLRWAVGRDRAGRAEWARRQQSRAAQGRAGAPGPFPGVAPPHANGHAPRRRGRRGRGPRANG